jgi:sortase B
VHQPSDSAIYTTNFHDEEGKQEYINLIKSLATYITTEEMTAEDRLVILSTCAYEYQEARYMVVGKMIPWE